MRRTIWTTDFNESRNSSGLMFFRFNRIKKEAENRPRNVWKNKMGENIQPTGLQIKGDKRFLLATCRHILFDGKCRHKCLNLATISWFWPLKSCNLRDVGVYQNEESIPNNFCWPRPGIYEHKLSFYLATRSYFENYYPKIDWINAPARTIHFAERCASKGANNINL